MANAARVNVTGNILYLTLDPASGTFTQGLTVDSTLLPDVAITCDDGGATPTVVEVEFEDKYPFADLGTNQAKIALRLDRRIKAGATCTVDIPADLAGDGTASTTASNDLAVTNTSYFYERGELSRLLKSTARVVYVDPDAGNDTIAAAVNGTGYYAPADVADLENPGSILSYRTLGAAASKIPDGTHGAILLKRGTTLNGTTHFIAAQQMLGNRGGAANDEPYVFAAYGSGNDWATLNPNGDETQGNRAWNWAGTRRHIVLGYGLDLQTGTHCIRINTPSTEGDYGHALVIGCRYDAITTTVATVNTGLRTRQNFGFIHNTISNGNAASGWAGSDNFGDFTYREVSSEENIMEEIGSLSSGLQHPIYAKSVGDLSIYRNAVRGCGGTFAKIDNCWGVSIKENILVDCSTIANAESNGDPDAGQPVNRTRIDDTGEYPDITIGSGAYSKWVTIKRNIITDCRTDANVDAVGLVLRYGQCYDSTIADNIGHFASGVQTQGIIWTHTGGSADFAHTAESYGLKAYNNTMVVDDTPTSQVYGFTINAPTSDSFSVQGSRGQHELLCARNVVYMTADVSGSTAAGIRIGNQNWEDANNAGRVSGTIDYNNFYRAGGSQTGFWLEFGETHADLAALQTSLNTITGSATGNRFEDPGLVDITKTLGAYATSEGHASLTAWFTALNTGIAAGDGTLAASIAEAQAFVVPNFHADGLSAANYAGAIPGVRNWIPDTAAPGTGVDIRVDGVPNGGDYTFGERNVSATDLEATLNLVNVGDATGTFGLISASGDAAIVSGPADNATLAADAGVELVVSLDRSTPGPKTGTVTIPVDGEDDYVFTVSAEILAAEGTVTNDSGLTISGDIVIDAEENEQVRYTVVLVNSGTATMTGISFTEDAGISTDSAKPLTLAPAASAGILYEIDTSELVTNEERTVTIEFDGGTPIVITFDVTVGIREESKQFWVRTGVTSGDGSQSNPYATVQEVLDNNTHVYGDSIWLDTQTNDLPNLGTITLTALSGLTIAAWPGYEAKLRNVALIEFPDVYDSTGTYDILATTETTYSADPTELIQDPETHDANGLKCQGDGAGFLVAATGADFAAKVVNMKATAGLWARDGGKLYVSVPKGDRNADHLWYRALTGMLIETSGACSDIVLDGLDLAYACQTTSTQNGNLIDIAGNIDGLTVRDCNLQVCYYHHIVTRGNETANVLIDNNFFGVVRGENDGICTLYAGTAFGTGCEIKRNTMYGYVWRDTSGAAYKVNNGVVKGYGHHHVGAEMVAGSLKVHHNVFRKDPGVTTAQHQAWSVSAGSCNHAIPSTISNFDEYAVQVYDNDFEGGIVNGASNSGSEICVAFRRNYCWGDFTGVADQTGMAGIGHITNNAGGGASKTRGLFEACVFSYNLADVTARSVFSITDSSATVGTSDAQAYCINCTFYNQRTSTPTNANYLVNNASNGDGLTITQCLLDAGYAIVPIGGNETPANQTWTRNWYSSGMSTTMHAPTATNRTTWASTYDTVGKYTDNPTFIDTQTGEPDETTRAFKMGATTGPDGINLGSFFGLWDDRFGAWQYGPIGGLRSRNRMRIR